MPVTPTLLWSDLLLFTLIAVAIVFGRIAWKSEPLRAALRLIVIKRSGMAAMTVLIAFFGIGILDSLHFRERLPYINGSAPVYSVEVLSVLDVLLMPLRVQTEKSYSVPLGTHLLSKETIGTSQEREYPRLKFGGANLSDLSLHGTDVLKRTCGGLALGFGTWLVVFGILRRFTRGSDVAWGSFFAVVFVFCLVVGPIFMLAQEYHVLGTDKVGQDVLFLAMKAIRTGLLMGTLTTLIMLPAAIFFGILAGYVGGWVDDLIQYVYSTLSSIPDVLLIAASVLMMQVVIDTHPNWFSSTAQRADARLLALCVILGVTSWTSLCRLLRAEALKLRELEFVQAAEAFGTSRPMVMLRHILPNVIHIILISVAIDFSHLVLAEAVLSYVGVGVDPNTISFGTMINAARMELAREPMVWWSLAAAFVFMFALVLAANLFADAVRDAFDPRMK